MDAFVAFVSNRLHLREGMEKIVNTLIPEN